jgi:thiosulfate dehydrogenase [quinone] large subunit
MRYPQTGIALLRIVVGAWFLKAVWTKLTLGTSRAWCPYPAVSPRFLAFHPSAWPSSPVDNPVGWYKDFLQSDRVAARERFATLQAYGEVVVGVGLVLGLLTRLAALVGLALSLNYGLATQWMSFGQQGFHVLLSPRCSSS